MVTTEWEVHQLRTDLLRELALTQHHRTSTTTVPWPSISVICSHFDDARHEGSK